MKNQPDFIKEMDRLAEKWDISALIRMEDGEGPIAEKAYGYADAGKQRPLRFSDRFCLSAHDLFFLALCFLHLFQQGKLRLSDKISEFIPEYPEGKKITIAQLLRMESGIPDELYQVRMPALQQDPHHAALSDEEKYRREYEEKARDAAFSDVYRHVAGLPLIHTPGQEEDGNVTAVWFLAEILRRHQGMTPLEYLMEHIFAPLSLADTRPGNDATVELFACMGESTLVSVPNLAPAHGFTTTLSDMHKLARALAEGRLLSRRVLQLALRVKRDYNGLGFCRMGEIYHADVFPGMLGNWLRIYFNFDEKMSWVILCNRDFTMRREPQTGWCAFTTELRRYWQYTRAYPDQPELVKITGKNVWDAMGVEITQAQYSYVPDAKTCVAVSLARRHPVYMLKDHGLAVGIIALTIDEKKKEYHVDFLQVDHRLQGRGYGRILLTHGIDILKAAGAKKLEIGVNRFNTPAQRLYLNAGFKLERIYEDFMELKMEL